MYLLIVLVVVVVLLTPIAPLFFDKKAIAQRTAKAYIKEVYPEANGSIVSCVEQGMGWPVDSKYYEITFKGINGKSQTIEVIKKSFLNNQEGIREDLYLDDFYIENILTQTFLEDVKNATLESDYHTYRISYFSNEPSDISNKVRNKLYSYDMYNKVDSYLKYKRGVNLKDMRLDLEIILSLKSNIASPTSSYMTLDFEKAKLNLARESRQIANTIRSKYPNIDDINFVYPYSVRDPDVESYIHHCEFSLKWEDSFNNDTDNQLLQRITTNYSSFDGQ